MRAKRASDAPTAGSGQECKPGRPGDRETRRPQGPQRWRDRNSFSLLLSIPAVPLLFQKERSMKKRLIIALALFLLVVGGLYAGPLSCSPTEARPKNSKN